MSLTTDGATDAFGDIEFGDTLRYVGPDEFEGDYVAPVEWKGPYEFRHVSVGGTLTLETVHNARRYYAPEHPANCRDYWEVADA